jgi:oxygen-independent coproporphyrinogen-3 oxidase
VAGVYISYPFCSQKCSFCNFASEVSSSETIAAYQAALLKQLRAHTWSWPPETLYFGGGTPSLMPVERLRELMATIPSENLREVTMEAAPGTLTQETLAAWRSLGVNRVSLGVQSFSISELRQTGRRHTAETVSSDAALLRAAGITNFNIDLIAGLPNQTSGSWCQSLDWIERLDAPHVSVYIFEVDEDSRLGKEMLLGGVRYGAGVMPCDDLIADLYETAVARLAASGIPRYEISNFAREGFASRHNLKYWQLEPYIGFGLDAHSHSDGRRFSSSDNMAEYLADPCLRAGDTATDRAEEHFFVGLRLDAGIQPTTAEWLRFAAPIEKWTSAGMLIRQGGRLRLSKGGVLVSNEIFQEFLTPVPEHA